MTTEVRSFGNTAGSNDVAGGLFSEGLRGDLTTDNLRQLQAAIRTYANEAEWFAIGDFSGPATFVYLASTRFRVANAERTDVYHRGRRVRATGVSTGIIYGTITAVTLNGGNTDVTVAWDSGSLDSETLLIELGVNSALNSSIPGRINHDIVVNGALETTGNMTVRGNLNLTGNANFQQVTTTDGPFNFLSMATRLAPGSTIDVPSTAKRAWLRIWGSAGGGSSNPTSFAGPVTPGANGATLTIATVPANVQIVVPGGQGGGTGTGDRAGRDAATDPNITTAGSALLSVAALPMAGAGGGQGANMGTSGSPGRFVQAYLNVENITGITHSGGAGGAGGSGPGGAADGGRGGRASLIAEFYG